MIRLTVLEFSCLKEAAFKTGDKDRRLGPRGVTIVKMQTHKLALEMQQLFTPVMPSPDGIPGLGLRPMDRQPSPPLGVPMYRKYRY